MKFQKFENEISIVVSGEAGQGLQLLENIFSKLVKLSGFHIFTYSEFMSRIRGGNNSTELRVSSKRIASFVDRIDFFVPISRDAMNRFSNRITKQTFIIGEKDRIGRKYISGNYNIINIPFSKLADKAGGRIFENIVIFGFFSALLSIDFRLIKNVIKESFSKKESNIIEKNINATKLGFDHASVKEVTDRISVSIKPDDRIMNELLLYGNEAIGIGALAGGCNFISSYPMSPSTGVLVFLAEKSDEFQIIVEQAEDEIAAINMALGAWYAGARAFVTTSGGGFALMTEGLSLAGAIESPIVIHIGQRPGPATGLPTRTEQGDLMMALYSGHGEFPKVIFAPGTLMQAIYLTCRAFNIADKYQIPVIILTDQFFLDSSSNTQKIDINKLNVEKYFIKTNKKYKRFAITESGISPRGIPGNGSGIVCVDSDEHDEGGYITEDFSLRTKMVNKRLKKYDEIINDIIPPTFFGSKYYKYLIVSWGSTHNTILEALKKINNKDIGYLHFSQVYPIYKGMKRYLEKAKKRIIIENNATSQFSHIIKLYTGFDFEYKILQYNGMPFSVEKLIYSITSYI